ncbi:MAG TPA: calcium-binding protein [Microvirga sp.]|jgi:Ca2+-binding RTX toxin-like protein
MTFSVWNNSEGQVAANSGMDREMVTALPNGGYVVAWRQGASDAGTIFFKIYNGLGAQVGGIHALPNVGQNQNIADIQAVGTEGSFAISWNEADPSKANSFSIRSRVYDVNGNVTSGADPVILASDLALNGRDTPSMARNGNSGFVTAYEVGSKIFLAVQGANGNAPTTIDVATATNINQVDVTEIGAGRFVVSYTEGGNNPTVQFKVITLGASAPPTSVSLGAGDDADVVALKGADGNSTGAFAVTVQNGSNVQTTFYSSPGTPGQSTTVTTQGLAQFDYVHTTALRGGRVAVVYSQYTEGQGGTPTDNGDIFLTIVSPNGAKNTYPVPLNSRATLDGSNQQYTPTVSEMTDGRIVVAWQDPSNNSITKVIFDPREAAVYVKGTAGNDHYVGTEYDNDELEGGAGADYLDGGARFDYASYSNSSRSVIASLADRSKNTNDAAGDTYVNIECLTGSAFNDELSGDAGVNWLLGQNGDDTLFGGAGDDVLRGGAGGDVLYGGAGADKMNGGEDSSYDRVSYENAAAAIVLNLNRLEKGENRGDAAGDEFTDIQAYIGSAFGDRMVGTDAYDEFFGGAGGDKLEGRGDNDKLFGQFGDDTLVGGTGGDTLDGGEGFDYASYEDAQIGVRASLTRVINFAPPLQNDATDDVLTSIEGLIGSAHEDVLRGDDLNNVLIGGGSSDILIAGGGNDTLEGGIGADQIAGGDGLDFASYANAGAGVVADLNNKPPVEEFAPWASLAGTNDAAGDIYVSIEGLIGSAHADRLIANADGNTLRGEGGDDTLEGGFGNDSLEGGSGNDRLVGGAGANTLNGGLGDDTYVSDGADAISEIGGGGNDMVYTSAASIDLGAMAGIERAQSTSTGAVGLTGNDLANTLYGNAGNDGLNGKEGNDTLYGGAGTDTLYGEGGNDELHGQEGTDLLYGGTGNDIYYLDTFGDQVFEGGGGGIDRIYSAANVNLGSQEVEFVHVEGAATVTGSNTANTVYGGAGANLLLGNGGNDVLYGFGGADRIKGGAGNDILFGGSARDRDAFVFDTRLNKRTNVDQIKDYNVRDDSIWLENKIFKALGKKGSEKKPVKIGSDAFTLGSKAQDAEDRILYNKKSGALYYDKDGVGGAAEVKIATLTKNLKMTHNDFFVI